MKSLREFEKERIMKMTKDIVKCICPSCKKTVYPRFIDYSNKIGYPDRSGLYWCPRCLKGKANMFWKEVE